MQKVIIFGIQDFAELAHYYLLKHKQCEIVAFTVHEKYLPENKIFKNLPVIPFEKLEQIYPPEIYTLFAPMSPTKMNTIRATIYREGKAKGYNFFSYISPKASCFDNQIGENCFILENNTLQPYTIIGNNVVLWSGNHIGHHSVIGDNVMFTSQVVLSGHCNVGKNSYIGVNACIRDGITIAEGSLIAMGAVIIKNTDPWSVYIGNPGKKIEAKNSIDSL
jgi:sugar O-acyltransferase (sialic acid O-acetyltransferase NeuD family)